MTSGRWHSRPVARTYAELAPAPGLAGVLRCEWVRSCGPEDEIVVLPDGCLDIVWRSDGALFVAGPDRGPAAHRHPAGAEFVGLRLQPGTAATVLGIPADELCDRHVPLTSLWGRPAERLADRLAHAGSHAERRQLLVAATVDRLSTSALDGAVIAAASALEGARATTAGLGDGSGLGARQLRRRFVQQVGYGPKTYERVTRFRRFLGLVGAADRPAGGLAGLAVAAGYADQAHLTRECRRLAGRTPAQLIGDRSVQDGSAARAG